MNIDDVQSPALDGRDRLELIFERQRELTEKYGPIEMSNGVGRGLIFGTSFHIDDLRWQYLMKDYAWRITEEIAEATDAMDHPDHLWEEAIDALHFLVELLITANVSIADVLANSDASAYLTDRTDGVADSLDRMFGWAGYRPGPRPRRMRFVVKINAYRVVEHLGLAMNCLKNKPWKQTQMETDATRFKLHLSLAFQSWVKFAILIGMDAGSVYDVYFRKFEVNKFRQRSGY